ncbi:MAG TPA: SRPBCC domain-containing protein [Acidimicrobiia bacterium]|jgi:uncharacterized protein YndB with AHSA1/START domain
MKYVDRRVFIDAAPAEVYELLTHADRFVEWMAPEADIDTRVGGTITWRHLNGDRCTGTFVELVPGRRIVFTYGWDRDDVRIPPGSTTVEITLQPRDGGTDLHLVHRDLPEPMVDPHAGGWANYLHRLAVAASGGDPGPDPLANERVPSARQVGLA